jgi:uncharacterized Fe-S cluster-containing protein
MTSIEVTKRQHDGSDDDNNEREQQSVDYCEYVLEHRCLNDEASHQLQRCKKTLIDHDEFLLKEYPDETDHDLALFKFLREHVRNGDIKGGWRTVSQWA